MIGQNTGFSQKGQGAAMDNGGGQVEHTVAVARKKLAEFLIAAQSVAEAGYSVGIIQSQPTGVPWSHADIDGNTKLTLGVSKVVTL